MGQLGVVPPIALARRLELVHHRQIRRRQIGRESPSALSLPFGLPHPLRLPHLCILVPHAACHLVITILIHATRWAFPAMSVSR